MVPRSKCKALPVRICWLGAREEFPFLVKRPRVLRPPSPWERGSWPRRTIDNIPGDSSKPTDSSTSWFCDLSANKFCDQSHQHPSNSCCSRMINKRRSMLLELDGYLDIWSVMVWFYFMYIPAYKIQVFRYENPASTCVSSRQGWYTESRIEDCKHRIPSISFPVGVAP